MKKKYVHTITHEGASIVHNSFKCNHPDCKKFVKSYAKNKDKCILISEKGGKCVNCGVTLVKLKDAFLYTCPNIHIINYLKKG